MSIACGLPLLECVYCLGCARWAWKRCLHSGSHDSENWGLATAEEFEPVPRLCRMVLAVYEDDLRNPLWAPPGGYGINPDWVILRKSYEDTHGRAPSYIIYVGHDNADIVLTIRGFNLAQESDYAVLLDNKLGRRKFDGGYVHNGLLNAAVWVLDEECEVLRELVEKYPSYTLTFTGHSLGSGVAALLTMVVVQNRDKLGNIDRKRIRCYAIAPARCMSLNLAVRYADVINSVVLQDDFLPRTATPLEDIFKSLFCLPCILCLGCMKDTCIPEEKMLSDPRRLYAPGRFYHIVERKPFRMGRFPPVVKTAVPVDGRFDHIVLSCNATSDHAIIWIERESQKALDLMLERDRIMEIPAKQRMERQESLAKEKSEEYKAALKRAVTLAVPYAYSSSPYGTFDKHEDSSSTSGEASLETSRKRRKESWDDFIGRLFDKDESDLIGPQFIRFEEEREDVEGNGDRICEGEIYVQAVLPSLRSATAKTSIPDGTNSYMLWNQFQAGTNLYMLWNQFQAAADLDSLSEGRGTKRSISVVLCRKQDSRGRRRQAGRLPFLIFPTLRRRRSEPIVLAFVIKCTLGCSFVGWKRCKILSCSTVLGIRSLIIRFRRTGSLLYDPLHMHSGSHHSSFWMKLKNVETLWCSMVTYEGDNTVLLLQDLLLLFLFLGKMMGDRTLNMHWRKEQKSRIFSGLKSRRDKVNSEAWSTNCHSELFDFIRIQMQISEAMNTLIWRRLMEFNSSTCECIDIPQISLELIKWFLQSDFLNEKSYAMEETIMIITQCFIFSQAYILEEFYKKFSEIVEAANDVIDSIHKDELAKYFLVKSDLEVDDGYRKELRTKEVEQEAIKNLIILCKSPELTHHVLYDSCGDQGQSLYVFSSCACNGNIASAGAAASSGASPMKMAVAAIPGAYIIGEERRCRCSGDIHYVHRVFVGISSGNGDLAARVHLYVGSRPSPHSIWFHYFCSCFCVHQIPNEFNL
ncbi:hypothetical protein NE237_028081 [Protea cynaroides]|uniref:Uncharacterized protein n=1 Tax=Protea cynaroides TaxID=273540 RepID=A0A9Q0GT38_9MAGN|nr:hypothetical protein NE237_028081 [Protea cynaroides]